MGSIVFASTGGRKYHFDKDCQAFHTAQGLNDWDCDEYCTHLHPRPRALNRMSATKAALDGKLPCLACVPNHLREMPEADDFGHKPVNEYDGTTEGDRGVTHIVCARCVIWTRWTDVAIWAGASVAWPCTSARVLGLTPRPPQ